MLNFLSVFALSAKEEKELRRQWAERDAIVERLENYIPNEPCDHIICHNDACDDCGMTFN